MKTAFKSIAHECEQGVKSKFKSEHYEIEHLEGMNEVYISSNINRGTSDNIFFFPHIDGPWVVYPFCHVYRCLVGLNDNNEYRTHFPMVPQTIALNKWEMYGFDFNATPHYIDKDETKKNKEQRMTLKIHYCVYPKGLKYYGRLLGLLTTVYDRIARYAFLKAIKPQSLSEHLGAQIIIWSAWLIVLAQEAIGYSNLAYLLFAYCFSGSTFIYWTSFIHYIKYIVTYYYRKDVAYYEFRRDVVFWKTIAVIQVVWLYLINFHFDFISLCLIFFGLILSTLAYLQLGPDRTYFGTELGICQFKKISNFPYSIMSHPMILGNIFIFIGIGVIIPNNVATFLHALFYCLHCLQEHYSFYQMVE